MPTDELKFIWGCTARHHDYPNQLWYRFGNGWMNLSDGQHSELYKDEEMTPSVFTFYDLEGSLIRQAVVVNAETREDLTEAIDELTEILKDIGFSHQDYGTYYSERADLQRRRTELIRKITKG
jgi:hypothetical protein